MKPERSPMGSRVAIGGLISCVLAGVWLFVAPFGLAYQPLGAHWITATRNDLATGGALILVGSITVIVYAAMSARDLLRRASLLRHDSPAESTEPAGAPDESGASTR